jgi:hypothetical protein
LLKLRRVAEEERMRKEEERRGKNDKHEAPQSLRVKKKSNP